MDHDSFPSGHSADAALLVVVVGAGGGGAIGGTFVPAMSGSRTWLSAHWLSETVAGASIGAGAVVGAGAVIGAGATLPLWRAFAPVAARERPLRRLPGNQHGVVQWQAGNTGALDQRIDGVRNQRG